MGKSSNLEVLLLLLHLSVYLVVSQRREYLIWLQNQIDDKIQALPDGIVVLAGNRAINYIPLEVTIESDSESDHCQTTDTKRYCPSEQTPGFDYTDYDALEGFESSTPIPTCLESACRYLNCPQQSPEALEASEEDVFGTLLIENTNGVSFEAYLEELGGSSDCGLTSSNSSIQFRPDLADASLCVDRGYRTQSAVILPAGPWALNNSNYTISFFVELDIRSVCSLFLLATGLPEQSSPNG